MGAHLTIADLPGLAAEWADERLTRDAARLVDAGVAEWRFDPWHADVAALAKRGTNDAYLVLWLTDKDVEVGTLFDKAAAVLAAHPQQTGDDLAALLADYLPGA
jgi:hypothetical protein